MGNHNIVKLWAFIWMMLDLQFHIQLHMLFPRFLDELCMHIIWRYSCKIRTNN